MSIEYTREYYIELLRQKAAERGALPKKSDFSNDEISRIKSFWGPWRHALEAAGLIDDKAFERSEKNREKRRRAKERREQYSQKPETKEEGRKETL